MYRMIITGSYLYGLQIRPRPNVELSKWSLLDFVPEPNEWNGKSGYFAMVNHGLEAPPLQLHMEFNVMLHNTIVFFFNNIHVDFQFLFYLTDKTESRWAID